MSHLKTWIEINHIYDDCRPGLIHSKFMNIKNFKSNYLHYLFLITPVIIGFSILPFKAFYPWMSLVNIIYMIGTIILINRILKPYYQEYDLLYLSYFSRKKFLHYARFKEACEKNNSLHPNKIEKLLEWYDISTSKFSTFKSFIKANIITASIASLISMIVYFFKQQKIIVEVSKKEIVSMLFFTLLLYFIIYIFYDISKANTKRDYEVSKFLKMYQKEVKG